MNDQELQNLPYEAKLALSAILARKEKARREQGTAPPNPWLRYQHDPVGFVQQGLNEFLWSKQQEIFRAVDTYDRVVVKSCHSSGKSFGAARLAAWWIASHEAGQAFVVTSAPTFAQVRAILWREINRVHRHARLPGYTNQTEWWINDEIVAFGRKPDDENITAFQGIHARYILVILDEGCHDDQTEVLTEFGWKLFSDLTGEEKLLSMSRETGLAEYLKPSRIYSEDYDGKMYYYSSRNADFCVTPDHNMWVKPYKWQQEGFWKYMRFNELRHKNNHYLTHEINWNGERWRTIDIDAFQNNKFSRPGKLFPSRRLNANDWFWILGWYFSEGHLIYTDHAVGFGISQKNPEILEEIAKVLKRLGFRPHVYENQVHVNDTQIAEHILAFGKGALVKRIPQYVRMACVEQINIFLDQFVRGDGYLHKSSEYIYSSNTGLSGDLQELILKTGVDSVQHTRKLAGIENDFGTHIGTSSVDGFTISRSFDSTNVKFQPDNVREIDYKGKVYCATVPPHHLLLTRRNGYALWSGNCGIPATLYNAAETLVSNGGKIVAIGNPDDPLTEFYRICEPGSGWHVITVSAFDTPNFTGEDVPQVLKDLLINPSWVEQRRQRWGETSPLYTAKILGDFPEVSVDSLVPISLVRAAMNRTLTPDKNDPNDLGVDVARKGNNESVIYHRHGPVAKLMGVLHKNDLMELTGWVVKAIKETGCTRVKIDDPGMGGGVTDRLKELRSLGELPRSCNIVPVNVGIGPTEKDPLKRRYFNLKSELSWELRELFETGKIQLVFSPQQYDDGTADDTVAQITAMKYRVMSNGLLRVASKDEMEKELAEINTDLESTSPDRWDALVLAFAEDAPVDKLSSWRKLANSMTR